MLARTWDGRAAVNGRRGKEKEKKSNSCMSPNNPPSFREGKEEKEKEKASEGHYAVHRGITFRLDMAVDTIVV